MRIKNLYQAYEAGSRNILGYNNSKIKGKLMFKDHYVKMKMVKILQLHLKYKIIT